MPRTPPVDLAQNPSKLTRWLGAPVDTVTTPIVSTPGPITERHRRLDRV